jgi:hypothetical protein
MIYAIAAFVVPAGLSPREIAYLAYAYLAASGTAQLPMAARMLYLGLPCESDRSCPSRCLLTLTAVMYVTDSLAPPPF